MRRCIPFTFDPPDHWTRSMLSEVREGRDDRNEPKDILACGWIDFPGGGGRASLAAGARVDRGAGRLDDPDVDQLARAPSRGLFGVPGIEPLPARLTNLRRVMESFGVRLSEIAQNVRTPAPG